MWEITVAFLVAIAVCFVFKQTRWLGAFGIFILVLVNPFLFVGLLIAGWAGISVVVSFWMSRAGRATPSGSGVGEVVVLIRASMPARRKNRGESW